ncbi:MAG: thiamine pyrophosphate-dependent dehydrogenase E1 component subunit alpha [Bacillota bacterium]
MLSKDLMVKLYEDMLMIREFEETVDEYAKKGRIPGFLHLAIGQEAAQAGAMAALKETDYKFLDHRSHGICILAGTPKEKVMAEIFGKKNGICQGKGGSMHIADVSVRNFGCNAIQGSTLAACLGTAVAAQLSDTDDVTAVFFGDGTVGRGEFNESLNLSGIWKLPIVYVLINNMYAISTPARNAHPLENLAEMGCAYDIPGLTIDGNDVLEVYKGVSKAVHRARQGQGPTLVELKTYRWQGHFSGDPASYRPEEEVRAWKERCPIKIHRERLLSQKIISHEENEKIIKQVKDEVARMLEFSIKSPEPEEELAIKHVYVGREVSGK